MFYDIYFLDYFYGLFCDKNSFFIGVLFFYLIRGYVEFNVFDYKLR